MRTLRRENRGFTLIELLVALLVFGIFSVLAYSGLTRLLDGRVRLNEQQRVWQQLGQVFMRISDDVAHARPRPVRDEAGVALLPAFVGRPYDSRALAEPGERRRVDGVIVTGKQARHPLVAPAAVPAAVHEDVRRHVRVRPGAVRTRER